MGELLDKVHRHLKPAVESISSGVEDESLSSFEGTGRFAVPNALACAYLDTRASTQPTEETVVTYESQLSCNNPWITLGPRSMRLCET